MLKKGDLSHNKCWGILIAAFGVFFLVANLVPHHGIMHYWPIFLIAGGLLKAFGCCCFGKCHK